MTRLQILIRPGLFELRRREEHSLPVPDGSGDVRLVLGPEATTQILSRGNTPETLAAAIADALHVYDVMDAEPAGRLAALVADVVMDID